MVTCFNSKAFIAGVVGARMNACSVLGFGECFADEMRPNVLDPCRSVFQRLFLDVSMLGAELRCHHLIFHQIQSIPKVCMLQTVPVSALRHANGDTGPLRWQDVAKHRLSMLAEAKLTVRFKWHVQHPLPYFS
jgi:hypothetical protein